MSVQSSQAKSRHALRSLERARRTLEEWVLSGAIQLLPGGDPDLAYNALMLIVQAGPPEEIALDIGQACAGAIGALDHLAWHAYVQSGGDTSKKGGIYFPKDQAAFSRDKWLQRIPPTVLRVFERVVDEGGHELSAVRTLGNVDKHQDLQVVAFIRREVSTEAPEMPSGLSLILEFPAGCIPLTPTPGIAVAGGLWESVTNGEAVPRTDAPPLPPLTASLLFGISSPGATSSVADVRSVIALTSVAADRYAAALAPHS